jgi:hypothetical protein
VELAETDADGVTEVLLFAVDMDVIEQFLIGVSGAEIREDVDLPYLDLRWRAGDLADGFTVSGVQRRYRTLSRSGLGPIAAARGDELNLSRLRGVAAKSRTSHMTTRLHHAWPGATGSYISVALTRERTAGDPAVSGIRRHSGPGAG